MLLCNLKQTVMIGFPYLSSVDTQKFDYFKLVINLSQSFSLFDVRPAI